MSDQIQSVARFPAYELFRNVMGGGILLILLLVQIILLSEHVHAEEMAELAQPLAITAYLIIGFMILPLIRWGLRGVLYWALNRQDTGGASA